MENGTGLSPEELLNQLQLFDVVIVRSGKDGGVYLTDGMREQLVEAVAISKDERDAESSSV